MSAGDFEALCALGAAVPDIASLFHEWEASHSMRSFMVFLADTRGLQIARPPLFDARLGGGVQRVDFRTRIHTPSAPNVTRGGGL